MGNLTAFASLAANTTPISGGTNTRVLFDDAGTVGENAGLTYTKASGLLAATALALGGATIGSNALAVTGAVAVTGAAAISSTLAVGGATIGSNALAVAGGIATSTSFTGATAALGGATIGSNALAVTGAAIISTTLTLAGVATVASAVTAPGLAGADTGGTYSALTVSGVSASQGNVIGWTTSTTNAFASRDTAVSRLSAGVVGVGTGANGSVAGSLSLTGLTTAGARTVGKSTYSASTTVAATDDLISLTGGVAQTLTLIAASTNAGRRFEIFNRAGGNWTLDATGLGTIVGNGVAAANTFTLVDNTGFVVESDGTKWLVI